MKSKTKELTYIAIMAAILAVLSTISIQIGTIPLTLSVFGVLIIAIIAGAKKSTAAVFIYILLGAVGLPVFSGFKGGIQVLVGPTGGYIISYIFMTVIVGMVSDKLKGANLKNMSLLFLSCIAGIAVCYLFGTVQYVLISSSDWATALKYCVYPFIGFDLIKSIIAVFVGTKIKKRISNI